MKTLVRDRNGQITKKIKPVASGTAHRAYEFVRGISFDPHPKRTKFMLGAKIAAITMAAPLVGTKVYNRFMRKSG